MPDAQRYDSKNLAPQACRLKIRPQANGDARARRRAYGARQGRGRARAKRRNRRVAQAQFAAHAQPFQARMRQKPSGDRPDEPRRGLPAAPGPGRLVQPPARRAQGHVRRKGPHAQRRGGGVSRPRAKRNADRRLQNIKRAQQDRRQRRQHFNLPLSPIPIRFRRRPRPHSTANGDLLQTKPRRGSRSPGSVRAMPRAKRALPGRSVPPPPFAPRAGKARPQTICARVFVSRTRRRPFAIPAAETCAKQGVREQYVPERRAKSLCLPLRRRNDALRAPARPRREQRRPPSRSPRSRSGRPPPVRTESAAHTSGCGAASASRLHFALDADVGKARPHARARLRHLHAQVLVAYCII